MVMDPRMPKQVEADVVVAERPIPERQRREDAVEVLTEALWELWLRRQSQPKQQAPARGAEEGKHG
ncbi:hypothetical protein ACJ2CR_18970 [Myxococcus faecalis]|uniref:hypothetical protein n=1 Tax=Myxococcus faecalis TaxID=3115646 RepID=UPI0038D2157E